MQNFRTKAHSIDRWGKIAVAAMLSVAMAAVIFWGLTRTGNTDKTVAEMSIAQTIRASGDTLSASLDTDKFTGTSIRQTRMLLEEEKGILRPANYHPSVPGSGMFVLDCLRWQLCVINLQGQMAMDNCANPFETVDRLLQKAGTKNILVDLHAEMTSEKKAMGYYLDGRVSAVVGTHTHVQTADERVLPKGTAYITDAGMCGGKNSVLGVKQEIIIKKFIDNMPARFEYDPKEIELNGVVISVDQSTGKAQSIQRVSVAD